MGQIKGRSCFLGLLVLSLSRIVEGFNFALLPNSQECFSYFVEAGTDCAGAFEVLRGSASSGLEVTITAAQGSDMYYSASKEREDQFQFIADHNDTYQVCFSGVSSRVLIGLGFHVDAAVGVDDTFVSEGDESAKKGEAQPCGYRYYC